MEVNRFTQNEFLSLIDIEKKYFERLREMEEKQLEVGLNLLDKSSQEIIKQIDHTIYLKLYSKVQSWVDTKAYSFGLGKVKQPFWLGLHRSLLPILYKDYKGFTVKDIDNLFDSTKINEYLLTTYPYLKKTLENIYLCYMDMRKEIELNGFNEKLKYNVELPTSRMKGFAKSTIKQLLTEIKNFNSKKEINVMLVHQLSSKGKNQKEIAQLTGVSQPTVCRVLKKVV